MEHFGLWIVIAFLASMNFASLKEILDLNSRLERIEKKEEL